MTRACRRCGQPWVAGDERCPACGYTSWLSLELPVPETVVRASTAVVPTAAGEVTASAPAPGPAPRWRFVPTPRLAWGLCLALLALPIISETMARVLLVLVRPNASGTTALTLAALSVLAAFVATRLLWPLWLGAVACSWWAVRLQRGARGA